MLYVVYYRVSDVKQGQSGLGLEAQRTMFATFLAARPGDVVGEYTEVETGKTLKKSLARPQLQRAIAHAREAGATLVIAKIDRLARNVAFISALMESDLPIVCCDLPEADKFTLHIIAAVAEHEGDAISKRTRAALTALKKRGVKLGSAREGHWDGRQRGFQQATQTAKRNADEQGRVCYEPLIPWIKFMREEGNTLQQIADKLNTISKTRTNKPWDIHTLRRVIAKYLGPEYLGQKTGVLNRCTVIGA